MNFRITKVITQSGILDTFFLNIIMIREIEKCKLVKPVYKRMKYFIVVLHYNFKILTTFLSSIKKKTGNARIL